jgi:succinyl-diaminopimelate desuccinylase
MQRISRIDHDLVVELAQRMVQWDTQNPPGNELPLVEYLAERIRGLGVEVQVMPITDQRGNLLGKVKGTGRHPPLVFSGHLDVVPPGSVPWTRDPFGAEVVNGRLYGRGSCDMKGGVAAIIGAAAAVAQSEPLAGDLLIALTAGEEGEALGAEHFVATRVLCGAGGLVFAEPTNLDVLTAEKGALLVEVTACGKASHGAMPHLGVNAVVGVTDLIQDFMRWSFPNPVHPLLGSPTVSVGTIQGGVKPTIVPDRCTVALDFRTLPGQSHSELLNALEGMCKRVTERRPGLSWKLRVINDRMPVDSPSDSRLVMAAQEAATKVRGTWRPVGGIAYYTDGATLAPALGAPMIICGPGDPGLAHQTDEWVPVDQLLQAAEIYVSLAEIFLAA